ncbi:MAG: hypothetical protein H7A51_05040 [Akkermansiaceae bacterium]|nr:hypothetical protein [Akkermansiaceae bacterium]
MNRISKGTFRLALMVALLAGIPGPAAGAQSELKGLYKEPRINKRLFGDDLSMVNNERDEYATNLAAYAVNQILLSSGDQESLDNARKVLGLALHLSPRNKKCVVINAQLKRGIMPEKVIADYDSDVFARLLLTRGKLLEKQQAEVNTLLARYLIALSATIDPRNEDAIYEAEIRRIDNGDVDWTKLTDAKPAATDPAAVPGSATPVHRPPFRRP